MAGVSPVFFKSLEGLFLDTYEVCVAGEKAAGGGSILGAQRIGQLWRVYPTSSSGRIALLAKGLDIRGHHISLVSRNPFIVRDGDGNQIPVTKLYIGNVPLSFANEEIKKGLEKMGVVLQSKMEQERARDPSGRLTNWQTGRRMVWVEVPKSPLPRYLDLGLFKGSLYHREMKQASDTSLCFGCGKPGHRVRECGERSGGVRKRQAERGVEEREAVGRVREVAEREVVEREVAEREVVVREVAERDVAEREVLEREVLERVVAERGVAEKGMEVRGVEKEGVDRADLVRERSGLRGQEMEVGDEQSGEVEDSTGEFEEERTESERSVFDGVGMDSEDQDEGSKYERGRMEKVTRSERRVRREMEKENGHNGDTKGRSEGKRIERVEKSRATLESDEEEEIGWREVVAKGKATKREEKKERGRKMLKEAQSSMERFVLSRSESRKRAGSPEGELRPLKQRTGKSPT